MTCHVKDCISLSVSQHAVLLGGYNVEICNPCLNKWHKRVVGSKLYRRMSAALVRIKAITAAGTGVGVMHAESVAFNLETQQSEVADCEFLFFRAAEFFVESGSLDGVDLE